MKLTIFAATTLLLAGCTNSLDTTSPDKIPTAVDSDRSKQKVVLDEIRILDQTLKYLTYEQYSCGDPNNALVRRETTLPPEKILKQRYAQVKLAMKSISDYAKALTDTVDKPDKLKTNLNLLGDDYSALTKGAANLGFPDTGLLTLPVTAAKDVVVAVADIKKSHDVESLALAYRKPLKESADQLNRYFVAVNKERKASYLLWEGCAIEYVRVLRDMSTGVSDGYLKKQPVHYLSSGTDLASAYRDYLSKRQSLSSEFDISALTTDLLNQNEALVQNGNVQFVRSFETLAEKIVALKKALPSEPN
jgi:hypothetical protein